MAKTGKRKPKTENRKPGSGDGRTKKKTATTLTKGTRLAIAKFAASNPDISVAAIADMYDCTVHQVRYAIGKGKEGRLQKKSTSTTRTIKAKLIENDKSEKEIFDQQKKYALAQLAADDKMSPDGRVTILYKLTRTEKLKTDHEMQLHLRGLDWQTFVETVKMLKPDASEKEIIRIYNEAKERCKVTAD